MFINLNITEISEGRGTLKQDIGPSSLAWGANLHQRVLEAGMTQTPHLLPLLSGAFPSRGSWLLPRWFPAGSSPPQARGSPGTSSSNPAPTRAAAPAPRHPKAAESKPVPSPSPHLGTPDTPPWAGPSTGDPSTLGAASAATSELVQQEKIYFLTVPPEETTLLLLLSTPRITPVLIPEPLFAPVI